MNSIMTVSIPQTPQIIAEPSWETELRTNKFGEKSMLVYIAESNAYYMAKIYHYDDANNPRTEWDNAAHMLCVHSRYQLGDVGLDKQIYFHAEEHDLWSDAKAWMEKEVGAVLICPLYLYDHSGITISMSRFSCRWDSGCVGLIYMTKKDIIDAFGGKILTQKLKERAWKLMEGEVETYDNYLTGNVFSYSVTRLDSKDDFTTDTDFDSDSFDSCNGYYGDHHESGIMDEIISSIKHDICTVAVERASFIRRILTRTKTYIKHQVPLLKRLPSNL